MNLGVPSRKFERMEISLMSNGNMNETPVYIDMVPSRTVDVRGKRQSRLRLPN